MTALDRFLKYVSFETTSLEEKPDAVSNDKILELTKNMVEELKELHPDEISVNQYGIVDAKFYGDDSKPMIALLAHMDTSNQASGKDVRPQIIKNYQGQDIVLHEGMVLSQKDFPSLTNALGHTIICTDGHTLLGGDDKAGIAIIMTALSEILEKKEKHRSLEIIFTTDEEIGADAEHVSMDIVKAKYGYTVDGGYDRMIANESFTAYSMHLDVQGKSIHPGSAKDKMVNASNVLMHFQNALPEFLRPEDTCDKEPFFHICSMQGNEDHACADYIIRSFDENQILQMIDLAKLTARRINDKLGYEAISLRIKNQYHNMKAVLDNYPEIMKEIVSVYEKFNLPYEYEAVRGGTTGSQLSFKGLPCPNLGTGDYNMHGQYEYVDYDEMQMMVKIVHELMLA